MTQPEDPPKSHCPVSIFVLKCAGVIAVKHISPDVNIRYPKEKITIATTDKTPDSIAFLVFFSLIFWIDLTIKVRIPNIINARISEPIKKLVTDFALKFINTETIKDNIIVDNQIILLM